MSIPTEGIPETLPTRIVKLQYKDYEEGEYTGIQRRTAEETIQLITDYPWDEQRDHLAIDLTNPSVTIESSNNDFLKLSPWYNQKLVLHYFDAEQHLFTKAFDHLPGTFPTIRSFFEKAPFDTTGFKKETTWLQSNANQFRTGHFIYWLRDYRFIGPSLAVLYFLFVAAMLSFALERLSVWTAMIPLILFLLLLARTVALATNHYQAAKGKLLTISRGRQEFSFGPAASPASFDKKDVQKIITYGLKNRGSYPSLTRVEIRFKDGRSLNISCLMIRQTDLLAKFPGCPRSEVSRGFPFISPSASTPF